MDKVNTTSNEAFTPQQDKPGATEELPELWGEPVEVEEEQAEKEEVTQLGDKAKVV